MSANIPRPDHEFLLHIVRQALEKIQKLDATIEVLKGVISGVVERDRGPKEKANFLNGFAEAEQQVLSRNRVELDQTIEALRRMMARGSKLDA